MAEIHSLILKSDSTQIKQSSKDLDGLSRSAGKTEKSVGGVTSSVAKLALGVTAIYAMKEAFEAVLKTGIKFNRSMENSVAGLTALTVATSSNTSAMGKSLSITEKYNLAQKEALQTAHELAKINAETPHTLDQTNQIYKAMFVSMKNVGATNQEMINLTKKISIAAGAAGIQFNSLLAGVDGLASGTVLANSDLGRFLGSLGLTNKTLKESDDVVGLLNDKFKDFEAVQTMDVAVSNLTNSWQQLAGTLTEDLFEDAKDGAIGLSGVLDTLNTKLKDYKANVEDIHDVHRLSNVEDAQRELEQLGMTYAELVTDGKGWLDSEVSYNAELKNQEALILSVTRKINRLTEAKDGLQAKPSTKEDFSIYAIDLQGFEEDTNFIMAQNKKAFEQKLKDEEEWQKAVVDFWADDEWFDEAKTGSVKLGDIVANQLGNSVSNSIQDAFDGDFDFQNIAGDLASSVGNALVSQVTASLAKAALESQALSYGGAFGIGVGAMALGSLFGGSDGKTAEEQRQEQIQAIQDQTNTITRSLDDQTKILKSFGEDFQSIRSENAASSEKVIGALKENVVVQLSTQSLRDYTKYGNAEIIQEMTNTLEDSTQPLHDYINYVYDTFPEGSSMRNSLLSASDDLALAYDQYTTDLLAVKDTYNDLSNSLKEVYDSLNDNYYANLELAQAQSEVNALIGDQSFSDYLKDVITGLDAFDTNILKLKNDLLSSDFETQFDALYALEESTGQSFENNTAKALDYIDSIVLVGESMVKSGKSIAEVQSEIDSAMLGSLSTIDTVQKLAYANNVRDMATDQDTAIASSLAIAQLSQQTSRTREEYAPAFAQYIQDLRNQTAEKTTTDLYDKLSDVETAIVNLDNNNQESAIYA